MKEEYFERFFGEGRNYLGFLIIDSIQGGGEEGYLE